ncbi:MAG: UvrB/UvrC motif-containing protein [bacterium]
MSCKQNPAAVKLTKLIKGSVEELWLCQECAAQQNPYQKKIGALSIEQVLATLLNQNKKEMAAKPRSVDIECSSCGLPFDSYRSTLLLGCSECYASFEKYLIADLRKFHGATTHCGRVPEGAPPVLEHNRNPREIRRRLREAVESEDFQRAARLRDELRQIELRAEGKES